jgi:hypothetical protein
VNFTNPVNSCDRQPLYQQIAHKFEDQSYIKNTRKEMGSPDCLQKPMYVVGKDSKNLPILRKMGSIALTILGTVTVIPAIYWTIKAVGEIFFLPVSSRIVRALFGSRDAAISPPKRPLQKVIEVIKAIAKVALAGAVIIVLGKVSLELGITTLVGMGIYYIAKHFITKRVAGEIKKNYADHIATGPKHMRMSVMVDGERIDTYVVMGRDKIESGQRWILATNGNGVPAEYVVSDLIGKNKSMLSDLQKKLKANVITYNYGGCLGSEGSVSTEKAAKIYQAMKTLLEDQQGLAAKEIIFYGHSLGGAFQAKGLKGSELKKNIKYVCVKDRTFSNTQDQLQTMFPKYLTKPAKSLARHLGFNIDVKEQCDELFLKKIPQVIVNNYYDPVIGAPLISKYDSEENNEKLIFTQKTYYYGTPQDDPHMDGPTSDEKNRLINHIEDVLTDHAKLQEE